MGRRSNIIFDGYVLPLATRMSKTGLSGSRGAELVQRALENRRKWLQDGDKISVVMLSGLDQKQNEVLFLFFWGLHTNKKTRKSKILMLLCKSV